MKYRTKAELNSCKGDAYGGDLVHRSFKVPERDWEDLQAYARANDTTAGEVVRCLIRELLEGKYEDKELAGTYHEEAKSFDSIKEEKKNG